MGTDEENGRNQSASSGSPKPTGEGSVEGESRRDARSRRTADKLLERSRLEWVSARKATQRLQELSTQLIEAHNTEVLFDKIVETTQAILRSDFASLHVFFPDRGAAGELKLIAHYGLSPQAAKFWEWVTAQCDSTFGVALRSRQQVIVPDVIRFEPMSGSEDLRVCLQAGIRAAQTTPLVSRSGELLGMISTFWRTTHKPARSELHSLDILAREAADLIDRKRNEETIQRHNAILQGINEILSAAWKCATEEALGKVCLEVARKVTQSGFGLIGELCSEGLRVIATDPGTSGGPANDFAAPPAGTFISQGLYAKVLQTQQGLLTNDPVRFPEGLGLPPGHPALKSFLAVPLIQEGQVTGLIACGNREGGYSREHQETLEALAPCMVQAFFRKRNEDRLTLSEAMLASQKQALQAANQRSQAILDRITDAFFAIDSQWRFTCANAGAERQLRVRMDQMIGHSVWDVIPESDHVRSHFEKAVSIGEPAHFEHFCGPFNVWFEVHAYPETGGLLVYFREITDRKKVEAQMIQLNRTLEAHNEVSHALLTAENEQAFLRHACSVIAERCGHALVWVGYAEHDSYKSVRPVAVVGFDPSHLEVLRVSWADIEAGRGPTGTAIRTCQPALFRNLQTSLNVSIWREKACELGLHCGLGLPLIRAGKAFGAVTLYSKDPNCFAEAETESLIKLAKDLSNGIETLRLRKAHRESEAALQESEALLRIAKDAVGLGIMDWNLQTMETQWDPRVREIWGLDPDVPASPEKFLQQVHPDDRALVLAAGEQALNPNDKGCYYVEYRVINARTGRTRWVAGWGQTTFREGKAIRVVGTILDITGRKEFQAELERLVAERTSRLEEMVADLEHFSYSITHDMRAPLRAMRGFAEVVLQMCESCPQGEQKEFLNRIAVSADRMDSLITDALNYSRAIRQELPLAPVDSGALLRGMLDSYPEFQHTKAQISVEGTLPVVMANEAGLTQCFSNLIGNAVKFVKPGQRPEIRIWAERQGEWVRFLVEDKGIGIAKSVIPRVFDMFTRGQNTYEGTGIGLALVRKVAHRMGGKVGVESEEGKGSRFWIELRAA